MSSEEERVEEEAQRLIDIELASKSQKESLSFCDRLKLLLSPIRSRQTVFKDDGDATTHIIIGPEAFRMWFYFGFIIYSMIAVFVTKNWSNLDMMNNPIYNRFGTSNVCVYYDLPPFSYFSAPLWIPQIINLLFYEYFDYFRVYDDYIDGKNGDKNIGQLFYIYYTSVSIFESLIFIFFINITAVTPVENIYLHSIPYVLLTYGLWSLAFKRFLYLYKSGFFNTYGQWLYILGWLYVILMLISVTIKSLIVIPNLFEAYLWEIDGLEWTQTAIQIEGKIWLILTVAVPIIVYFFISKDMTTVEIIMNRGKGMKSN